MDTSVNSRPAIELLDAYRSSGTQIATIYLPSPSAHADAEARLETRRSNVLRELKELEATSSLIDVVADQLDQLAHHEADSFVIAATSEKVLTTQRLVRPVVSTQVTVGPCPSLLALLEAIQADQDHLAVLVDRAGADVYFRTGVGEPAAQTEVDGETLHLHRSHPGGWSQRRFQQIAENTWEANAQQVVDEIEAAFPERTRVIIGGDERAVGFVVKHLPARMSPPIVVDGSRHSGPESFLDNADVELRSLAATKTVAALDDYRSALGAGEAASGQEALQMLGQGRARELLVVNDSDSTDRATGRFDFENQLFVGHQPQSTSSAAVEAPLTDAAVALAVARGTAVTVIPRIGDIDDGVAVTLRG